MFGVYGKNVEPKYELNLPEVKNSKEEYLTVGKNGSMSWQPKKKVVKEETIKEPKEPEEEIVKPKKRVVVSPTLKSVKKEPARLKTPYNENSIYAPKKEPIKFLSYISNDAYFTKRFGARKENESVSEWIARGQYELRQKKQ